MTPQITWLTDRLRTAIARLDKAEAALDECSSEAGPAALTASTIAGFVELDLAESEAAVALLRLVDNVVGGEPGTSYRAHQALRQEMVSERPWPLHAAWLRMISDGSACELLEALDEGEDRDEDEEAA